MDGMSLIDGTCWIHFCWGPLLLQPAGEGGERKHEGQPYLMPTCSLLHQPAPPEQELTLERHGSTWEGSIPVTAVCPGYPDFSPQWTLVAKQHSKLITGQ